jgi:hypothetical protein
MSDFDPFGGNGGRQRRPWFGRRRIGYGYSPRTWQGWLVTAVLVAIAIAVGSATTGNAGLLIVGIAPVVLVPLAIIWYSAAGDRLAGRCLRRKPTALSRRR